MRERVGAVDVKRCRNGVLARREVVASHNVGRKRTGGGLIAVNRNLVERRAVLMESDLNAVAFNLIFNIKLIGQLAAVEGKSLSGDVSKTDGLGKIDDGLLGAVDAYAELTEEVAPLGSGSVTKGLNDNEL